MSAVKQSPEWALDNVRFDSDAGDDLTCREYLCALLRVLWREQEGFSGKRPFGNSGWEWDMEDALREAACIGNGVREGHQFVSDMIDALTKPAVTTLRAQEGT